MTDTSLIFIFIEAMKTNRAPATIARYIRILKLFLKEGFSYFTASRVDIQNFFAEKGLSGESRNERLNVLRKLYLWALIHGEVLSDPTLGIEYLRKPKKLPQNIMSEGETVRLIDALKPLEKETDYLKWRNYLIAELMYSASLRRSEAVALNIKDYDWQLQSLRIKAGKTRRGRVIPIGHNVGRILEKYITSTRSAMKTKEGHELALFLNYRGERLNPDTVTKFISETRKEINLRTKATSHSLRKSSATHMLRRGAGLVSVQALLGHKAIASTEAYTKLYPKDIFKMHRAHHPREKQKNIELPDFEVPTLMYRRNGKSKK